MAIFDLSDIDGFCIDGKIICFDCYINKDPDELGIVQKGEEIQLTEANLLFHDDLVENEQVAFCDKCEKPI